jgi:hypothetical protein
VGGFQANATREGMQAKRGSKEVLDSFAHQSSSMESPIYATTDEKVLPKGKREEILRLLSLTFAEVDQAK